MNGCKEAVVYLTVFLVLRLDFLEGFYVQPEVPEFKVHPSSHLLLGNSSINLTCSLLLQNTTANVPHPQIQWLMNGTPITQMLSHGWNVSTSSDTESLTSWLHLTRLSTRHSGHYQCLARDGTVGGAFCDSDMPIPCLGSHVLSGRGWVKVITGEPVEPELRQISVPGSILLECGSEIIEPIRSLIEVEWMSGGTIITNSSNLFQLTNGNIVVYDSVAREINLECYVTTNTDRVIYRAYNVVSTDQIETSLRVSISLTDTIVSRGHTVQLACLVIPGNSSLTTNITWFRNFGSLLERSMLRLGDHVLILNEVDDNSTGQYCCEMGGAEACTNIGIIDKVTRAKPAQQFINFRNNRSHCVNTSCHVPRSLSPILWFQNGNELDDASQHDLLRCSDDPYQLYGVYQCMIGLNGEYNHLMGRDLGVILRVLPYGITNPVGGISIRELPQPSPIRPDFYYTILMTWAPPIYLSNLSSVTYRIVHQSEGAVVYNSTSEMQRLYVRNYNQLSVLIFVHHEELGDISSAILFYAGARPYQCSRITLFPPQILDTSCTSGVVQVNFTYDGVSNRLRSNIVNESPKHFYFMGNCTYFQTTYEIEYEMSENSPYVVGDGRRFEPGTRCILAAANTPVLVGMQTAPDFCFDEKYLLYSDFHSCTVYAVVGFKSTNTYALLSSGHFEVCVEGRGLGYNITISSNSSTFLDYETEMHFSLSSISPFTTQCVNISIPDNGVPGSTEVAALSIQSSSAFVRIERNVTITTIGNDAVFARFQSYSSQVSETAGSANICVVIETIPKRKRPISVNLHGSGEGIGNSGAIQKVVTFGSEDMAIQCVSISITDDNVLSDKKIWSFYLFSDEDLVRVDPTPAVITIMDDDEVYINLIPQPYFDCNGVCNVSVNITGALNKTVNATLITESEVNFPLQFLLLNDSSGTQSFQLVIEENRRRKRFHDPLRVSFRLDSSNGIVMCLNETRISVEKNCDRDHMIVALAVVMLGLVAAASVCIIAAAVAAQKNRARNKYRRFQKELINSFKTTDGMDEDTVYLTQFPTPSGGPDDDNLSEIVSLEPYFVDSSVVMSPDMSLILMPLDGSDGLDYSGERCDEDSGGYINHLDEADDRQFLLPPTSCGLNISERELPPTSISSSGSSRDEWNNSSMGSSESDELNQNTLTNSNFPSNFQESSPRSNSTLEHIVSSDVSIRQDNDETDDSGYPRNTLDSNQEEFSYDHLAVN